jgi:hypothetical protein
MKKSKYNKLNALEKAVVDDILVEEAHILFKKGNKGWSDTPLFRSAAEEKQTVLF